MSSKSFKTFYRTPGDVAGSDNDKDSTAAAGNFEELIGIFSYYKL